MLRSGCFPGQKYLIALLRHRYQTEAVAVRQGGIIAKQAKWLQEGRPYLLALEDPQVPTAGITGVCEIREPIFNTKIQFVCLLLLRIQHMEFQPCYRYLGSHET